MKKEDLLHDDRGAVPCKHCRRKGKIVYPRIDEVDEMFYARCPCCKHWDIYDFLALTKTKCIQVWNRTMEAKNISSKSSWED